jgi:hypothetical protein
MKGALPVSNVKYRVKRFIFHPHSAPPSWIPAVAYGDNALCAQSTRDTVLSLFTACNTYFAPRRVSHLGRQRVGAHTLLGDAQLCFIPHQRKMHAGALLQMLAQLLTSHLTPATPSVAPA